MTPQAVNVSDETLEFIKRWEGFSSHAYWDVSRWSIGHGTVSHEFETISKDEAAERLKAALQRFADELSEAIVFTPTEGQATALLSAAYNLGTGALRYEITGLCNEGKFREAADALRGYDHANGAVLTALTARREAEATLLEAGLRGQPRVQYARTYWLMPPDATMAEFKQASVAAFNTRATIGYSADDAGIGDLNIRNVILVEPNRQPSGILQWFELHYPDVHVTGRPLADTVPAERVVPERGSALVGVHGSADGNWGHPMSTFQDLNIAQTAKVDAWKFLSNENATSVDELRAFKPDIFIMVRLFAHAEELPLGRFLDKVCSAISPFYAKGVTHFEVHNEPNLRAEGMWNEWQNGVDFAAWFVQVCLRLRSEYPDILLGFPGLSPGHSIANIRYSAIEFYQEAEQATEAADWIGAHCYWQTSGEMLSTSGGAGYKKLITDKPILITEFSNPNPSVAKAIKADQYVSYYNALKGVHSAYSFVASASSGFDAETWANSEIPHIVGERA